MRWQRRAWLLVAIVIVADLLAVLASVVTAHADPVAMRPQSYDKVSRDGWQLNIRTDHEIVNSVPNLAATPTSREAFVTVSGTATAVGGLSTITDSLFVIGYQLGCQVDVSTGLQAGGTAALGPTTALGIGGGSPGGASVGTTGGLAGYAQTVLQPGIIADLPLSNMALSEGGQAMIDVDNIHVKADGCGGPVSIRSYAFLRISTPAAHTQFAVYGDPIQI